MALSEFSKAVQDRINALLTEQIRQLADHAPTLRKAMEYALLMGGKRMRPVLVYATADMLEVKQADADAVALAIECIHAYSLVHDDLPAMDDDDLRRGHPTCHIAFDEASAILAGDALQTLAFDILAHAPLSEQAECSRVELFKILSRASGYQGMCGGQAMDLAATNESIPQEQLESLHQKKTGALLKAAITMPIALAGNVSPENNKQLHMFAECVGLAFQVQDDILDVVGDSEILGKPQGSDQAQNKSTYPALLGLTGAQEYLQQLHQQALQALRSLPYNTKVLQSFADYNVQRNH